MKLISLNTHSLIEKEWKKKCRMFSSVVSDEHADIVAMQEVNQTHDAEPFDENKLKQMGYICCKNGVVIRKDNYMLEFVNHWKRLNPGKECNWTWLPMKLGYSKYDEGLAIFSIHPIIEIKTGYITAQMDYNNWRTRMILGAFIDVGGEKQWFYSVHAGWWKEEKDPSIDPFWIQWNRLEAEVKTEDPNTIWILGDLNNPAHIRKEGYDYVKQSGWFDCYELAEQKDNGITVKENIDGWKEKEKITGMRIDFIWCNQKRNIKTSQVIMNGVQGAIVSDHFGIMITEGKEK